jgi:hypothetical protein
MFSLLVLIPPAIAQSSLTLSVSTDKTQYSAGETVSLSGKVQDNSNNPVMGATVSIEVDDPQGKPVDVHLIDTDQSGSYSESLILPTNSVQGQYRVYATVSKPGFTTAQAQTQFSVSAQTTFTSSSAQTTSSQTTSSETTSTQTTPPSFGKCFIATATYGSELSPEVALLRHFRDSDVLATSAGRNFMTAFNAVYYTFSPQVAVVIASHNLLRSAMKIVLYPLIGILYVSSRVFSMFSFEPEFAVTLSGVFAALGIGVIYVGPMTMILVRLSRSRLASQRIRNLIVGSGPTFLGLVALAELVNSDTFLKLAAVATVLSFAALGGFSAASVGSRLRLRKRAH